MRRQSVWWYLPISDSPEGVQHAQERAGVEGAVSRMVAAVLSTQWYSGLTPHSVQAWAPWARKLSACLAKALPAFHSPPSAQAAEEWGRDVGVACLKFSHNRAVCLGLLLVEFEGLAEILQALEARHCL